MGCNTDAVLPGREAVVVATLAQAVAEEEVPKQVGEVQPTAPSLMAVVAGVDVPGLPQASLWRTRNVGVRVRRKEVEVAAAESDVSGGTVVVGHSGFGVHTSYMGEMLDHCHPKNHHSSGSGPDTWNWTSVGLG